METGTAELQQHLGKRFKFNEQELVLNRSGRLSNRLYYNINDQRLPVSHKDYYTVVEGLIYRVHYTRWSKQIVSIELEKE